MCLGGFLGVPLRLRLCRLLLLLMVMMLLVWTLIAVVMVIRLLPPRLLNRCALLDALIVALPLKLCVRGKRQYPSHGFTVGQVSR
jgi:hypothetical protein